MIPYILHISILIIILFGFYQLLLASETHFKLNRYLLIGGIMMAFLLPHLKIPAKWSMWYQLPGQSLEAIEEESTLSNPVNLPVIPNNIVKQDSLEEMLPPVATPKSTPEPSYWSQISWIQILKYLYWVGVLVFAIHALIQLGTLIYQVIRYPSLKDDQFRIVELDNDQPPYSFGNFIFINPTLYAWEKYEQIIEHEKIHISQKHSFDMIIAELLVISLWFNPAAWAIRKLIENNLEFLTDASMLRNGVDRTDYQLNLLEVCVPQHPIGMAMNYNQSILKKRIKMMNTKKSSVQSSWKYVLLVPVIGLSILAFNGIIAQEFSDNETLSEKRWGDNNTDNERTLDPKISERNLVLTDEELIEEPRLVEEEGLENRPLLAANDEYITELDDNAFDATLKGFWWAEMDTEGLCIKFDHSDLRNRNNWSTTRCFDRNEFKGYSGNGDVTFTLTRKAGEVVFNGTMEDDQGNGRFTFTVNEAFKTYLNKKGYSNLKEETLLLLFIADINEAYFDYLKQKGYTSISEKELRNLAVHGLDLAYLKEHLPLFKDKGLDKPSIKELIKLRIHGVSSTYIQEMTTIGFKDLDLEDLIKGRIHGVDPDYVKEIRALGYPNLVFEDYIKFSIHGVNKEVVESLGKAGFDNLSAEKIVQVRIHGVSPRYIDELKKAGYELSDVDEIIRFKIHGVDLDFVKRLQEMGYGSLSADQITKAAIHGVRADYIESFKNLGYNDLSIDKVIKMRIHGVSSSYVQRLNELGYKGIEPDQIIKARIHGVQIDHIEDYKELGFKNIPMEELIRLKIHGVTPGFIKKAQYQGMKDLSLDQYRKLKIHGIVDN